MGGVDRVPGLETVITVVAGLIVVGGIGSAVSRQTFPPVNAVDIGGFDVLPMVILVVFVGAILLTLFYTVVVRSPSSADGTEGDA